MAGSSFVRGERREFIVVLRAFAQLWTSKSEHEGPGFVFRLGIWMESEVLENDFEYRMIKIFAGGSFKGVISSGL